MSSRGEVTNLLQRWQSGHPAALDDLIPLVYGELKTLARAYLRRERDGHTLQPTALVHEAFLKLVDQRISWQNRSHFFGIAAQCMRRVLVDHARRRQAAKRGGEPTNIRLSSDVEIAVPSAAHMVALDDALTALEALDQRQSRVVELRYFGGLSVEEVASILDVSTATIKREWSTARMWLQREMARTTR